VHFRQSRPLRGETPLKRFKHGPIKKPVKRGGDPKMKRGDIHTRCHKKKKISERGVWEKEGRGEARWEIGKVRERNLATGRKKGLGEKKEKS